MDMSACVWLSAAPQAFRSARLGTLIQRGEGQLRAARFVLGAEFALESTA